MANIKFSQFSESTDVANVDFVVGYDGATNVRISPNNFINTIGGPFLPLAGGTMAGVTTFNDHTQHGDQVKAKWGAGNDLEIYHNASNSFIDDTGAGSLFVRADDSIEFKSYTADESLARFISNDRIELYFNGSKKFETTNTGAAVTGDIDIKVGSAIHGTITSSSDSLTLNARNTGIMLFQSGGAEKMRISQAGAIKFNAYGAGTLVTDANGNITASSGGGAGGPFLPLAGGTMAGDIQMSANNLKFDESGTRSWNIGASSGNLNITSGDSDGSVAISTGLSVQDNAIFTGNVGIGTTSPQQKLDIKSDPLNTNQPVRISDSVSDTHTGLFLNGIGNTVGEKYGVQFGSFNQYSIGGIFSILDSTAGSTSGDLTIDLCNGTSAGSLVERVRFTHEGNVGIGTATPNQKLQVGGNLHIYDEEGNTDTSLFLSSGTLDVTTVKINSNGTSFLNGGNLGIGTTTPTAARLVVSSGVTDPEILVKNTAGNNAIILFEDNSGGTQNASITFDQANQNTLTIATGFASTTDLNRINIAPAGNVGLTVRGGNGGSGLGQPLVGIGTTTPTAKLQVVGLTEHADNAAAITAGLTAGAFYRTGDLLKVVH